MDDETLLALYTCSIKHSWSGKDGLMRKAADEIVRLRGELDDIKADLIKSHEEIDVSEVE